jgi:hypothetical protein
MYLLFIAFVLSPRVSGVRLNESRENRRAEVSAANQKVRRRNCESKKNRYLQ